MTDIVEKETMNWPVPVDRPTQTIQYQPKPYRWEVTMTLPQPLSAPQAHSSAFTRNQGLYNCMDINVGMWISDINNGKTWQVIRVVQKTNTEIIALIQDVYRYNTFKDPTKQGNGGPASGNYIAFELGPDGLPALDTDVLLSPVFATNLHGRFDYINLQYDFPLYQLNNTFAVNDVIAVDQVTHKFVKADATYKKAIGRVTSISDTISGWFTINPVQKVVDFLDALPGDVGDTIYASTTNPEQVTTELGGAELYIKLRNNTSSITNSTASGPTTPGDKFNLNSTTITVGGSGTTADLISAVNGATSVTGISAMTVLNPTVAISNLSDTEYGQVVQFIGSPSARATINGVSVTFNIPSTEDPTLSLVNDIVSAINQANIPNIVAEAISGNTRIQLTNTIGGPITIVNVQADSSGLNFAGGVSGSGLPLITAASTQTSVRFTSIDARPIEFINVLGNSIENFGLISVENGTKACGLYVQSGLRQSSSNVVSDLAALAGLTPIIGDQAYVIDSDDGNNNFVDQWSTWVYDGSEWVLTARQSAATVDSKSIVYNLSTTSPSSFNIGSLTTGRRIVLVTVQVSTQFNGTPTLNIGYSVNSDPTPEVVTNGLMSNNELNLNVVNTYTSTSNILFGTSTAQGDVTITGEFSLGGASAGAARIIVSYV